MTTSLILFDIDGTLLQSEKNLIPVSTVEALQKLKEAGHKLAIATGRALFLVDEQIRALPFDTFVTANGQHIMHQGEVIYENAIPKAVIERLIEKSHTRQQGIGLLSATRSGLTKYTDELAKSFNRVSIPIPEFKEELRFVPWLDFGADIVPLNGSKAEGIKQLVNHLKEKPKRVIAFGDGYNDIEMLQLADIGVAMGNASDEVKAHADFVTKRIDEDGIYYACEQLGLF